MRERHLAIIAALTLASTGNSSLAWGSDPFGPRPVFDWIKAGDPRPTPRISETEIGIESMPVLSVTGKPGAVGSVVSLGDPSSDCYHDRQALACLRRNWLAVLGVLREDELSTPSGGESYRLLLFPSFAPWVSVRLDVGADRTAVMTISKALHSTLKGDTPLGHSSASISARDVDAMESALKAASFEHLSPEPEPSLNICMDGSDVVLEAVVDGRYRYIARHSCDSDFDQIWAMTVQIRTLAGLVDPLHPRR